jgi:hypothetical protein
MPIVNEIHVVVDVEDDRYVGTNSPLNLTISGNGIDLFDGSWTGSNTLGFGDTVPRNRSGAALVPSDTENRRQLADSSGLFVRSDLYSDMSYFIYTDENPYAPSFDTAQLDPSSIRFGIRGADLLYPRHIIVWGLADLPLANYLTAPATVRTPVPLGLALNVNKRLSTTFSEGPQSMLIPRVAPWRRANPADAERRVDQVIVTIGLGSDSNAPSPSPVSFRILAADGTLLCSQTLEGADSLRSGEWKTWLFPVTTPFTWSDIMPIPPPPQPCRLRVEGENMLQVAHVYAFGIDSSSTPAAILPLVHSANIDTWIGGEEQSREYLLQTANHDVSEAR